MLFARHSGKLAHERGLRAACHKGIASLVHRQAHVQLSHLTLAFLACHKGIASLVDIRAQVLSHLTLAFSACHKGIASLIHRQAQVLSHLTLAFLAGVTRSQTGSCPECILRIMS